MVTENINSLTKKEIEQLKNTLEVKKNIISYLNIEKFISEVVKIIDECPSFDFRSNISKTFIDRRQPIFVLKLTDPSMTTSKTMDEVNSMLYVEIISKISVLLTDCLLKDEGDVFEGVPAEMKDFIISNIYVIRNNLKENNIQLFFFM